MKFGNFTFKTKLVKEQGYLSCPKKFSIWFEYYIDKNIWVSQAQFKQILLQLNIYLAEIVELSQFKLNLKCITVIVELGEHRAIFEVHFIDTPNCCYDFKNLGGQGTSTQGQVFLDFSSVMCNLRTFVLLVISNIEV